MENFCSLVNSGVCFEGAPLFVFFIQCTWYAGADAVSANIYILMLRLFFYPHKIVTIIFAITACRRGYGAGWLAAEFE